MLHFIHSKLQSENKMTFSCTFRYPRLVFAGNSYIWEKRPSAPTCGVVASSIMESKQYTSGEEFIRPHMRKLAPYTPIEPFEVLSTRLGRRPEEIVKLDANENPYGPPPEVLQALGNLSFPNIYPDPESRALRQALSNWQGVAVEHLLV